MAYWSIALLLLSLAFLAIRHPPPGFNALPRWLGPSKRRSQEQMEDKPSGSFQTRGVGNGHIKGPEAIVDSEDLSETETTPKASATQVDSEIPTFALHDASSVEDSVEEQEHVVSGTTRTAPSFPAANSAQRSSSMMPPPRPTPTKFQQKFGNLMAPPPRPTNVSALRSPSSGPLPNRGPPTNSQQRVGGGLTANGTVSTPNPRGKVLLSPGHSPMDWAALTRKGNLSGVSTFQRVTPSMLKSMTGRKGKPAWSSWQGNVYNITPYLPFHPGGEPEIMKAAGRDGTKLFMEAHPWVNWENMLGSCLVGVMVPEDYGTTDGKRSSQLEDID